MDGLSAFANGIAVVSLAIQLDDTVRDIQGFLKLVSEAPKELKWLLELREQLELILEGVGSMVQMQNYQAGTRTQDGLAMTSLLKALNNCSTDVEPLNKLVKAAKSVSDGSRFERAIGSLKLACKAIDIEDFEARTQNDLMVLTVAMTINPNVSWETYLGILRSNRQQNFDLLKKEL